MFSIESFFQYFSILWHLKSKISIWEWKPKMEIWCRITTESSRLLCCIASISTCENTVLLRSTSRPLGTYSFPYWMYGSPCVGSSHSVMLFEHLSSSALISHLQKCYPGGWRLLWHIVARKKHLKHAHSVWQMVFAPLCQHNNTARLHWRAT